MTALDRVAVTGAAGFIGSHLCEELLDIGSEVVGVDDLSYGSLRNLDSCLREPSFTFVRMDCTERHSLRTVVRNCSSLVHLAGRKIPRYGDAAAMLKANVAGFGAVCEAAVEAGTELCIASSSDVYGMARPPLAEDSALVLGPSTTRRWAYAVSKLYGEHLALSLSQEANLRVRVLRLFGCYGPRNHPSWWGGPQAAFIEALLDGRPMEIHGNGRQVRSFTYVSDAVKGIVNALRLPAARGEIINIGNPTAGTILDLAKLVQATVGVAPPLRVRFVPYDTFPGRYQDVRLRIPEITKARKLLGFEAHVDLADGIRRTVEWHRSQRLSSPMRTNLPSA